MGRGVHHRQAGHGHGGGGGEEGVFPTGVGVVYGSDGEGEQDSSRSDEEGEAVEENERGGEYARGGSANSKAEYPRLHVSQPGASDYALIEPARTVGCQIIPLERVPLGARKQLGMEAPLVDSQV